MNVFINWLILGFELGFWRKILNIFFSIFLFSDIFSWCGFEFFLHLLVLVMDFEDVLWVIIFFIVEKYVELRL
jgi:hypothetical protein